MDVDIEACTEIYSLNDGVAVTLADIDGLWDAYIYIWVDSDGEGCDGGGGPRGPMFAG